jgi:hypothetical protein
MSGNPPSGNQSFAHTVMMSGYLAQVRSVPGLPYPGFPRAHASLPLLMQILRSPGYPQQLPRSLWDSPEMHYIPSADSFHRQTCRLAPTIHCHLLGAYRQLCTTIPMSKTPMASSGQAFDSLPDTENAVGNNQEFNEQVLHVHAPTWVAMAVSDAVPDILPH